MYRRKVRACVPDKNRVACRSRISRRGAIGAVTRARARASNLAPAVICFCTSAKQKLTVRRARSRAKRLIAQVRSEQARNGRTSWPRHFNLYRDYFPGGAEPTQHLAGCLGAFIARRLATVSRRLIGNYVAPARYVLPLRAVNNSKVCGAATRPLRGDLSRTFGGKHFPR